MKYKYVNIFILQFVCNIIKYLQTQVKNSFGHRQQTPKQNNEIEFCILKSSIQKYKNEYTVLVDSL